MKILGEDEKEIYLEAARKAAEKFDHGSLAYRTITHGINTRNVTGSQFFWVNHLDSCLPQNQKVISLAEMEMLNNYDETLFEGIYAYVPEIVLRTETPVNQKEQIVLEDLVEQIKGNKHEFSSENPLRISGLELVKDDNPENAYGLLLKIGNDSKISVDKKLAASNTGSEISFGGKKKRIWTRKDSLSAICLGGGASLYTDGGFELYADCVCRVVVFDAEAAKKLPRE
ncbi:MAG: hypothetical protein ACC641_09205 [Acidiferrobacterales bacterium]